MNQATLERNFFRALNAVITPAVRLGVGSPRIAPLGLILLESVGFKSGNQRRTPLLALKLGKHVIVSTARGERSFWVKNLRQQPKTRYFLRGRPKSSNAVVFAPGMETPRGQLPSGLEKLDDFLPGYAEKGWAFAVLSPE